jgi:predicted dehydrogenase
MNKYKVLLIGYSSIARKRILKTFIKNKISFCVATKSFKKKVKGSYQQYDDYNKALKYSNADIVYLSLPNSMHFYWSKKILNSGFHLIVDKPITTKIEELNKLIEIAKKKNLLLTEATFFNYHRQFKFVKNFIGKLSNIEQVFVNFTIPMPKKNSLLLSKKLKGGAFMDMSPYVASINRILFEEDIIQKSIIVKKNIKKLITSFDVFFRYKTKIFVGTFRFGKCYKNIISIYLRNKSIEINRVFSPPADIKLKIQVNSQYKLKTFLIDKDNCFENYLFEVIKNIKKKRYTFYTNRMMQDGNFRSRLIK